MFSALASEKINIFLISQGPSEINISYDSYLIYANISLPSFVVRADDTNHAMNVVHEKALQIPTYFEKRIILLKVKSSTVLV
jgi:aspartokinase